jgi:hypothetical protein
MAAGRPKIKLNREQIVKLAMLNCSHSEIGAVLGCSQDTIERNYADAIKEGREKGRMSLKRKMYETAMGGSVTMMIWLSKQMCGYTDKVETKNETAITETRPVTPKELKAAIASDPFISGVISNSNGIAS